MLIILLILSACQEIQISIESPALYQESTNIQPSRTPIKETLPPISTSTLSPTQTTFSTTETNSKDYFSAGIDPYSVLLGWEDLPLEVYFSGGHLKMYDVSYLYNPGTLLGTAYVREFFSYPHDLFFTEILIQSPVKITSEMLRAGFYSDTVYPVEEAWQVGEMALAGERQDQLHTFAYRFAEGNTMVVLALQGSHPYASFETVVDLAQKIHQRFPQPMPADQGLPLMGQTLNAELYQTYFQDLVLVDCTQEHNQTNVFMVGDQGFCFRADVKDLIFDLKTGIYSTKYQKLFYVKFFECLPQLGVWTDFVKHPVWDFGWQHLPEGEYEVWFWVNDELAAKLPFTYQPATN